MPEGNRRVGVEVFASAAEASREMSTFKQSVSETGAAVSDANSRAAVAAQGLSSSSNAAAAALGATSTAATGTTRSVQQLDREIALAQRTLALWRGEIVAAEADENTDKAVLEGLRAEYKQLGAEIAVLRAEQRLLAVETATTASEERAATTATQQAAVAQTELTAATAAGAEASSLSAAQMLRVGGAVDKLALGVNTGARQLSVLAGAFSAASLPQFALIIGVSLLIGELLKLGKAKEVHVELNDKLIAQDIVLAQTAETAAERASKEKVVRGDLIAILSLLIDHSEKYNKAVEAQKNAQTELTLAQLRQEDAMNGVAASAGAFGENLGNAFVPGIKSAGQSVAEHTDEMQKNRAELDKNIESIIKFANETGKANDVIIRQAQEMGADADVIKRLTDELNSGLRAQRQWQAALDDQTIPAVNLRNTIEGEAQARKQLIERINGQVTAGKSLRDVVEANRSALEAELKSIKDGIDLDVAAGRVKGTHAAMQAELNRRIAEGHDGLEKYLAVVKASDEAHKNWSNSTDKATAAAKALALATNELVKESEIATAKDTVGDKGKFAALEEQVHAEIAAKRFALQQKNQLTADNNVLLLGIEQARIDRIKEDEIKARQEAATRIRAIYDAAIINEYDRHVAMVEKQVDEDRKFFTNLGISKNEIDALTTEARKGREDEFQRWFIEANRKSYEQIAKEGARFEHQLNQEKQREDAAFFKQQLRDFEQHEKEMQALIDKFGQRSGGHVAILDVNEIDKINNRLKALGLSVKGVDEHFGHATSNVHVFELRLKALERFSKGDYFGGLRASIKAVTLDMLESGQMAHTMGDLLESSFSRAVASGKSFLSTLGASLIQGMADIVAQVLKQIGLMLISKGIADVLMGIAINSNPFTAGAGTALIHAGTMEIVEGGLLGIAAGVVSGLGSLAGNAIQGNNSNSPTAGAGASGATTGGATPPRQQPASIIIDLSSSARQSQRPMHVTLELDRNVSNDLIQGKKVLTAGNIKDQNYKAVKRVVRKMK